MNKRHLLEAASLASDAPAEDGTWVVRIISEGKGSSGIYTAELLENHHSAFDELLSFTNHPVGWDGLESRDFTMISGQVVGKTWVDKDERGLTAVYANWLPDPSHREKLELYKSKLGLSIFIEGSGYEDENGEFIVDWFNPQDPFASIDVVIAAGARGKFMESARKAYASVLADAEKPGVTSALEERKLVMEKDVEDRFAAIEALLTALVEKNEAAKAEAAQAEADAEAGRIAVEAYDAAVSAIDKADLPEKVVETLRTQAKEGIDVTPLIAQAVEIKEAAEAAVSDRLHGSGDQGRNFGTGRKVESAVDLGKAFG